MADDWIKMRTDLYRDPKVCVIAGLLMGETSELSRYVSQNMQCDMSVTSNVMRNVTVGALVSVWGVLRHRGKRVGDDLEVKGCGIGVIDDIADLPGFGEAMAEVGWVVEVSEGLVLPRFFEDFNVDPTEEAREKNAERQRKYRRRLKEKRDVTGDVTVASFCHAREEKSREENKEDKDPPTPRKPLAVEIPPTLDTEAFRTAWGDWLADRKARGKTVTERAARGQLGKLAALSPDKAVACIQESIANGWTGLFPERFLAPGSNGTPHRRPQSRGEAQDDYFATVAQDAIFPGGNP